MRSKLLRVVSCVVVLMLTLGSLPGAVQASPGADFSIEPSTQTVNVDQIFTVDILVDASIQEVDTTEAYVDFDTNYLKVVDETGNIIEGTANDIIIPGEITTTHLTMKLKNQVNNTDGYADIAYGMPPGGTPANEVFVLGTIRFKALAETTDTAVTFHATGLRTTIAVRLAADVTGTRSDGNVTVSRTDITPPLVTMDITPPLVTIASPEDGLNTSNPSQIVTGTIDDTAITPATLILNGMPQTIAITDGSFSQVVTLVEGLNTISVSAIDAAGNVGTSQITVKMTSAPPGDSNDDSGSVDTNNLTGSPKGEDTPTSPRAKPINWPVLWGVIGGVVVVALLIFFSVRRKSY